MTIPEIAAQLRVALVLCVCAAKDVSTEDRIYFTSQQNDSSDEEVLAFWLSVSYLDVHQVPMFVAEKWAKRASSVNHWMALLERNTAPLGNN